MVRRLRLLRIGSYVLVFAIGAAVAGIALGSGGQPRVFACVDASGAPTKLRTSAFPSGACDSPSRVIAWDKQPLSSAGAARIEAAVTASRNQLASVRAITKKFRGGADVTSGDGTLETLKLQREMDRMAQLTQALSNMLKKESDTSESILDNLK